MTYGEAIDLLFNKLPYYQRSGPAAYKPDLSRTYEILEAVDNPHKGMRVVHVAGTNGKGSVSHMVASILQEAGYKTGLMTSPHLIDFRERFRIDGKMIPEEKVVDFVERATPLLDSISPSFFELTVAMGFEWFAQESIDIAVIEVGLGGRLDSTNVVDPEVSVITSIGMDHQQFLGNSISSIAREKGGIIKPGKPVVIGDLPPKAEYVITGIAKERGSELFKIEDTWFQEWETDLLGSYQKHNSRLAALTSFILRGSDWNITDDNISNGLQNVVNNTGLLGRWQQIDTSPLTIVDIAHNKDAWEAIVDQMRPFGANGVSIVVSMVGDKTIDQTFEAMPKWATYYFTQSSVDRSLSAEELLTKAELAGFKGKAIKDPISAIEEARMNTSDSGLVVVTGSAYVVGDVLLRS